MKTNELMKYLKSVGGIHELYEIRRFCGFRENKSGESIDFELSILDMGEECDDLSLRYSCTVKQSDKKTTAGTPASTIKEAIQNIHWHNLDK